MYTRTHYIDEYKSVLQMDYCIPFNNLIVHMYREL